MAPGCLACGGPGHVTGTCVALGAALHRKLSAQGDVVELILRLLCGGWSWSAGETRPGRAVLCASHGPRAGDAVAVGDAGGCVHLVCPLTGVRMLSAALAAPHPVASLCWASDGESITVAYFKFIRAFDSQSGAAVTAPLAGHTHAVNSVALCARSARLASGSDDKTVRIWRMPPAAGGQGAPEQTLRGHSNSILSVAFEPHGALLASGSADKTIRVWDLSTGVALSVFGTDARVNCVAFSSDGARMAAGDGDYRGGSVRLFDVPSRALIGRALTGHAHAVMSIAWSADGTTLASGGYDKTIKIWSAPLSSPSPLPLLSPAERQGDSRLEATLRSEHPVLCVSLSPDGCQLVASNGPDVRLCRVHAGALLGAW